MLARLFAKSDVYTFKIEIFGDIKTFDFLNVKHHESGNVLTQVTNIIRDGERLIGECKIIGYRDSGVLKNIRTPFTNDCDIQIADDKFIEDVVDLNTDTNNFIGVVEHHPNLRICLDMKKTITKHIAILAKSGAGKSYTVGVILEEVLKKNIPVVILDPHNEYTSLKYPNPNKKDLKRLEKFNLKAEGFLDRVKEYSPDTEINSHCESISLDINKLKPHDLMDALPQKLSPGQQSLMFNIMSNLSNSVNLDELMFHLSNEDSNSKWSLISMLEQFKKLKLYSATPTPLSEIVKHKRVSLVSLKGVDPYVQEAFVSGLLRDLFDARKKEEIPPFLLVVEEAHNFCPERSLGEVKSSRIIRTIAAEGRKFGLGLCVISQRPAKIDKNVVSQCSTQILLKITNPNDLRAVISSSEGVSSDSEQEIQKLNIGTCLLTGVIDIPLKINIRPRISKHGGETVDITLPYEVEDDDESVPSYNGSVDEDNEEIKEREHQERTFDKKKDEKVFHEGAHSEFIQHIAPEIEAEDAKVMMDAEKIEVQLVPGFVVKMKDLQGKEHNLLFDRVNTQLIKTLVPFEGVSLKQYSTSLSDSEMKLLKIIFGLGEMFNPAEILMKTDIMYNEILRSCENLYKKGFLKKEGQNFGLKGENLAKDISKADFYGQQKFEEISYDTQLDPQVSEEEMKQILSLFGVVEHVKEIVILRYVGK